MESVPELKFLVEEKRGAIDVFTAWLPRLALVFAFVVIGATKFGNDRGEWYRIFELIGLGQWFRYFTGAVQVSGALMMLTPWTRTAGAFLLACTMIGAIIVDIFVAHAVGFAFAPLVLLCIIAATWFAGRE
ncbi:MAG TPA: DoxX family protein [Vicinamibacterales bacterium]|nr:DoxX family protein [Vicinamibacterales bacterium]